MKFSIGAKLWAGFIAILFVLIIVGATAYLSTAKVADTAQWVSHTHKVLAKLNDLRSALLDAETGQRGYLVTGEERYLGPYQMAVQRVDGELRVIRELTADNPDQQRKLDAIAPVVMEKLNELKETIDLRKGKGFEAARQVVLTDKGKKTMDTLRTLTGEMENQENELLKRRDEEAQASSHNTVMTIVVGILVASVLVLVSGFVLTRNISEPLKEVTRIAEKITAGDLTTNVAFGSRTDEVGALTRAFARMTQTLQEMAEAAKRIAAGDLTTRIKPQSEKDVLGNAFATMTDNLRDMTREINTSVSVLPVSTNEILTATTQVASGSVETATAVSQTTSTVAEVKQAAQVSAEKAKHVSESAQKTAQISQNGKKSVDESMAAMRRIQEQMESIAENVVGLSEQGQAIGEIVATVNDLAEQSNLLAVNASIEAAKAGEQGKGFAVVAQEVKSLAVQSKQATAQVRTILGDIQKATSGAVMATEQGSKAVESGMKLSGEMGESIRVLADSIDEAAMAATQIAVSAQQQLIGMDQVALAMQNINQASGQTVTSTKQTEIAAQNLHELGLKLKRMAERYQV